MSNKKNNLDRILECIEDIDFILTDSNLKITQALEHRILKPAIRMNIVIIAEQFKNLQDKLEFEVLENFTKEDLKGISAVRNYIAHDYDSTDDNIIEGVIRYHLPTIKTTIEEIKSKNLENIVAMHEKSLEKDSSNSESKELSQDQNEDSTKSKVRKNR